MCDGWRAVVTLIDGTKFDFPLYCNDEDGHIHDTNAALQFAARGYPQAVSIDIFAMGEIPDIDEEGHDH